MRRDRQDAISLIQKRKNEFGGHKVEMGAAGVLKKCDLGSRAARLRAPGREVVEVAQDSVFPERSGFEWLGDVGNVDGRFPAVDVNAAQANAIVVRLARVQVEAADQIEMRAWPEPASANERSIGACTGRDDVGATNSRYQVRTWFGAHTFR